MFYLILFVEKLLEIFRLDDILICCPSNAPYLALYAIAVKSLNK